MSNSQVPRKVWLALVTAGLLMVAGCSNQPDQATNQPAVPAKKAAPAKPANRPAGTATAANKPAPAAKPAAKPAAQSSAAKTTTTASAKPASSKSAAPAAKPASASSKVAPATKLVTVPKGTFLNATLTQPLASNKNKAGDSFSATLRSSVKVDGKTVIPKGAKLTGHVITAKKKTAELTVAISSVEISGKSYPLHTDSFNPAAAAQAKTGDDSEAKPKKEVALAAQSHVKFKLAKSAKLPVKS